MRYTYQQLEVIRERARGLGLKAEFESRPSDPDEVFLVVPMPEVGDSLSYFTALGRLSSIQAWGDVSAAAAEIDKLHAALTADFSEPVEPRSVSSCDSCPLARIPVACAAEPDCPGANSETSEATL